MVNFLRIQDDKVGVDMLVNMDLISTISKTSNGRAHIVFIKAGTDCPSSFTSLESFDEIMCRFCDFIK